MALEASGRGAERVAVGLLQVFIPVSFGESPELVAMVPAEGSEGVGGHCEVWLGFLEGDR
jgi:hypothetical protein